MKIAVFYDKSKPQIDLVYATTIKTDVVLEKIILDVEPSDNIIKDVYAILGVEYQELQSDCGPEGC
jgi:hypothetical protein